MKNVAVVALLLMAAVACGGDPEVGDPRRSTVGIEAAGCELVPSWGTGVVVGDPSTVVTVAHTIAGATTITVHDAQGTPHAAELRAFDPASDLAVLHVASLDARPLAIQPATMATRATLVRFDLKAEPKELVTIEVSTVKRLKVTIEDIYLDHKVQRHAFELSGDIVTGDSGGPIVSATGAVWGVVYAASRARENVGFAVDDGEIREILATSSNEPVAPGRCL